MVKLWRKLPPLLADNFGLIEVMNKTDGMGIIDDCSEYRTSAQRRRGRRGEGGSDMRVVHTEISSEHVVSGTRQQVLDTFNRYRRDFDPAFVVLSAGPCSAMIGTDLNEIAEQIQADSGIKTAAVNLTGHKTYDVGIAETLSALVRLLAEPGTVRQGHINILGANTLDWQEENAAALRGWIEEKGFSVIVNLGGSERAKAIAKAPEASVNLVVTGSGLAAAKYLKQEYGTPYIVMAPFGKSWTEALSEALQSGKQPGSSAQTDGSIQPETLIIGEQVMGNAIRETLIRDYGMKNIQVCTFYTLAKELAWPGDKRIRSEQDAEKLLRDGAYRTVIADPLLRCFAPEGATWIDLPHKAFQLYGDHTPVPLLLGENLNRWLDGQMVGRSVV